MGIQSPYAALTLDVEAATQGTVRDRAAGAAAAAAERSRLTGPQGFRR